MKATMNYSKMTADEILAEATGRDKMSKDAALALYGTIARYQTHVAVWRAARGLRYAESRMTDEAEAWTLGDCTCQMTNLRNAKGRPMFGEMCETGPDGDDTWAPVARVHGFCGGDGGAPSMSISGRASARIDEACEGCTCQGHLRDMRDNAVAGLRETIREAGRQDAAWDALSAPERRAIVARERRGKARAEMHYARPLSHGPERSPAGLMALILGMDAANILATPEAPADLSPALTEALAEAPAHSCGPKVEGETWRAYAARNGRHCPGCEAERSAVGYGAGPVAPSIPSMTAGVIRGDRVAAKGRNAHLGAGQGHGRIGKASPLAG